MVQKIQTKSTNISIKLSVSTTGCDELLPLRGQLYSMSASLLQCGLVISLFKCKWDLWWFVMDRKVHRDYSLFNLYSSAMCVSACMCACVLVLQAWNKVAALTEGTITEWSFFSGSQKYLLIVCVSSLRVTCGGLSRGCIDGGRKRNRRRRKLH